jgi:hypothetical protein
MAIHALVLLAPLALLPRDWDESLAQSIAFSAAGWKEVKRTAEVAVFVDKRSRFIRLGADARINVPPATLLEALADYERYKGVMGNLRDSKVLARGEGWKTAYQRISVPMISDRDFAMRLTWGKQGTLHWLRYWSEDNPAWPRQKGVVRVPYARGSWQLTPVDGGRATALRHQSSLDMAGWLPGWVARSFAGKRLVSLFTDVCTLLERRGEKPVPCLLPLR